VILYRHADPRYPFLWEDASQPAGRWHAEGEGPAHYFADTPDGAWAELVRHEELATPEDLEGVARALWAVDVPDEPAVEPALPAATLRGGLGSHAACRVEAGRLRAKGARRLDAPSAALLPGGAAGRRVAGGVQPGPARDGRVIVLFGARPDLVGWAVVGDGRPPEALLERVRPLRARG
jgi:hypothetical protein